MYTKGANGEPGVDSRLNLLPALKSIKMREDSCGVTPLHELFALLGYYLYKKLRPYIF